MRTAVEKYSIQHQTKSVGKYSKVYEFLYNIACLLCKRNQSLHDAFIMDIKNLHQVLQRLLE